MATTPKKRVKKMAQPTPKVETVKDPICSICDKPLSRVRWTPYGEDVLVVSHDTDDCGKVIGVCNQRRSITV